MFLDYCEKMNRIWKKNASTLLLAKTGILGFPIIKESGGGLSGPLAIVTEDEKAIEDIFREISGFGFKKIIPLGIPKREFERCMIEVEYELMPIFCKDISERSRENLLMLVNAMISEEVNGHYFKALPVIAFIGGIPIEYVEFISGKIVVEGKKEINKFANSTEIVKIFVEEIYENISIIQQKFEKLHCNDKYRFLHSAAEILKILVDKLIDNNADFRSKLINDVEMELERTEARWDIENELSAEIDLLRKILFESPVGICGTFNRDDIASDEKRWLEWCMIYDEKYYYLTPECFKKACDKLPYISCVELKKALYDAGILIGEGVNRCYYTTKVSIRTTHGIRVIGRRLRVLRKWLDLPGELSWQEKIDEQMKRHPVVIVPPKKNVTKKG